MAAVRRALNFNLTFKKNITNGPARNIRKHWNNAYTFQNKQIKQMGRIFSFLFGRSYQLAFSLIPSFAVVHAWGWGATEEKTSQGAAASQLSEEEILLTKADELYAQNDVLSLYELLLAYRNAHNDEILWRLARAACDKGKMSTTDVDKKALIYEAFEYIKKALEVNEKNYAVHKWYAILLDYTGEYEGTKARIANAYIVKEHLLKAIELNPQDATSIHSLGYWCFLFADLPWYQRKIASVIFTTPPSSSYEEALKYFHRAEEVDPNFYSTNLLMLGKTYLRMGQKEAAQSFLIKARDFPVISEDDKKAHKEAMELLKSL